MTDEVLALHPNATVIKRQGEVNAWDNPSFKSAVKATGKKQVILGGITTDVSFALFRWRPLRSDAVAPGLHGLPRTLPPQRGLQRFCEQRRVGNVQRKDCERCQRPDARRGCASSVDVRCCLGAYARLAKYPGRIGDAPFL